MTPEEEKRLLGLVHNSDKQLTALTSKIATLARKLDLCLERLDMDAAENNQRILYQAGVDELNRRSSYTTAVRHSGGADDDSQVVRYPMPDDGWIVIVYEAGEVVSMEYEDKEGRALAGHP
jgi:hypothetical protein